MKKYLIFGAVPLQIILFTIAINFPSAFVPLMIAGGVYLFVCAIVTWMRLKNGEISKMELANIIFILLACVIMLYMENDIITLLREMKTE